MFLMNLFSLESHWTYKASIMNILTDTVNIVRNIATTQNEHANTKLQYKGTYRSFKHTLSDGKTECVFSIKQYLSTSSTTLCKKLSY